MDQPVKPKTLSTERRPRDRQRSRAAAVPERRLVAIVPMSLISPDDLRRISADAAERDHRLQIRAASDEKWEQIALDLHFGFDGAVNCEETRKWEAEPAKARNWYTQVAARADGLLEALNMSRDQVAGPAGPAREKCRDASERGLLLPAIADFRGLVDCMSRRRPELPVELDRLSRVAYEEDGASAEGDGIDAEGHCQYRARASFLIDRLPRTVALLAELAEWQLQRLQQPSGSGKPFALAACELFKALAGAHKAIFGCKPRTRNKVGDPLGGSIDWAKAVIRHAADAIETSPRSVPFRASEAQILAESRLIAAPYVAWCRELANLEPRTFVDRLRDGWLACNASAR